MRELQRQNRSLERDKNTITREQMKLKQQLKAEAKKQGHEGAVRTMAKSIVRSQAASDRLTEAQTRINSVCYQLKSQQATSNVVGVMGKSVGVMQQMSALIKLPEMAETARNMSREMAKAGLIDEMMNETMDSLDDSSLESEADAEVDKVMYELTDGQFGSIAALKPRAKVEQEAVVDAADEQKTSAAQQKQLADLKAALK